MSPEGEYNIRFRHDLGDIGPLIFTKDATIQQVKERLLAEWPNEGELAKQSPSSPAELFLILRGKYVDLSKALFDYEREMGDLGPGTCLTMHLVIRKENSQKQNTKEGKMKCCGCCCIQ